MADLLDALSGLLAPLGEMSLTAAYVAVIVLVLRLLLKNRAPRQVTCLLWLVVFARLLIPVSLESPVSLVPRQLQAVQFEQLHRPDPVPAVSQTVQSGSVPNQSQGQTVIPDQSHGQMTPEQTVPRLTQPEQTGSAPVLTTPDGWTPSTIVPASPTAEPADLSVETVLAGVWLAGALAMAGYALISYIRIRRRLFDAILAKDGAWEHPAVGSPFILGMFRPKIYLPAGVSGEARRFILCHERAHLRRLDHVIKPICWAALAIHWFNPAVWLAFLLLSRDIEAACDEAVLRHLGSQVKADYSSTLLALATNRHFPAPSPLAFGEDGAKTRIKHVLSYRRPTLWIVVVSVVATLLAAVCLLTDPVSASDDPSNGPDNSYQEDDLALPSETPAPELDGYALLWEAGSDGPALYTPDGTTADEASNYRLYVLYEGELTGLEDAPSLAAEEFRSLGPCWADLDGNGCNELFFATWTGIGGGNLHETLYVYECGPNGWQGTQLYTEEVYGPGGYVPPFAATPEATVTPLPEQGAVQISASGVEGVIPVSEDAFENGAVLNVVFNPYATHTFLYVNGALYLRASGHVERTDLSPGFPGQYTVGEVEYLLGVSYEYHGLDSFTTALYSISPGCGDLGYFPELMRESIVSDAHYWESDLALLDVFPSHPAAYLYQDGNGQLILRKGAYIGPLPPEADGWPAGYLMGQPYVNGYLFDFGFGSDEVYMVLSANDGVDYQNLALMWADSGWMALPLPDASALEIPAPIPDALLAVLLEAAPFIAVDYYEPGPLPTTTLSQYTVTGSPSDHPVRFTVLDMDGDGQTEVVLEMNDYHGYLVLNVQNGTAYGHFFVYRGMENLKADGTHMGDNSAFNSMIMKIKSFAKTGWERETLAEYDTAQYPQYFTINGQPATEGQVDALFRFQWAKPDAIWYDFTDYNLRAVADTLATVGFPFPPQCYSIAIPWGTELEPAELFTYDGATSVWLDWNGDIFRLPDDVSQSLLEETIHHHFYCRDFDGDGDAEFSIIVSDPTYEQDGNFTAYIFEKADGQLVLAASYDTAEFTTDFNNRSVARYDPDTQSYTLSYDRFSVSGYYRFDNFEYYDDLSGPVTRGLAWRGSNTGGYHGGTFCFGLDIPISLADSTMEVSYDLSRYVYPAYMHFYLRYDGSRLYPDEMELVVRWPDGIPT